MNTLQKPAWMTRALLTLTTVALVVLGFFFLTIALAVGTLVALVIGVRLWWTIRKLKRAQSVSDSVTGTAGDRVVEGEYQVIEHESSVTRLPPER